MKILIATGIYPPEIGGPAYYAASLKSALERQGHIVVVVLYGRLKLLPSGIRHLCYALKLLARAPRADLIIAFDTYSTGLPAAIVHTVMRTPLVIRIGGDFVWEMYVERTKDLLPLPHFYEWRDRWRWRERVSFALSRWALHRARVVFSTAWLLGIWREAYDLRAGRATVIENAIEEKIEPLKPVRKNFIFYTRQIALKNRGAFLRAFAKAKATNPEIELDEGVAPHAELLKRMRECYAVALPSISEVTPNYIIDALRCGKPFLLTKYSGYAERFGRYGVLIDPLDGDDIARGIERLADPAEYEILRKRVSSFNERHTYDDIARAFIAFAKTI